jgi:hypothetical protein
MPQRLFLDTGVIVAGVRQPWGAAKAVLIHVTERDRFTVVLAEVVRQELESVLAGLAADLAADEHTRVADALHGWLRRVRVELWPAPTLAAVQAARPALLPAIRHLNDLPVVVSALEARPDWVIAENEAHWNPSLAARTGLAILTPRQFLRRMILPIG